MQSKYKFALAVVAGLLVGAAADRGLHGQPVKPTPVYVISEVESFTDLPAIQTQYAPKVDATLAPFAGHFHRVVFGGKAESLDGDAPPQAMVVIAFDSSEEAHAWYNSPAYAAIRPIRQAAVKGRMFLVPGAVQ